MNRKHLNWFIGGVLFGAAACVNALLIANWPILGSSKQDSAPIDTPLFQEVTRLNQENQALKDEIASLKSDLEQTARIAEPNFPAPPSGPPDFIPNTPPPSGPPPNFQEMVMRARENQFNNQMTQLKAALGLTDDQLALLDDAVAQFLDRNNGNPMGLFGLGALAENGALRQILDPIMSPDQQSALGDYMETERGNQVEILTNAQLMQLQAMVNLSETQKDQAFARFAELAEARIDQQIESGDGAGTRSTRAATMFQDNSAAMEDILTPEQMQVYQQAMEQQRRMVEQFRQQAGQGSPGGNSGSGTMTIVMPGGGTGNSSEGSPPESSEETPSPNP